MGAPDKTCENCRYFLDTTGNGMGVCHLSGEDTHAYNTCDGFLPIEHKPKQDVRERRLMKVYTVVDMPGDRPAKLLEVGLGSVARDGTISVKLEAYPTNGTLLLREWK